MSKTKNRSRFFTVIFIAALMMALSTSVFADYSRISYRPMYADRYSNNWLNVMRNSTSISAKGKNMSLWYATSPSTDQYFDEVYKTVSGRSGYIISFSADPSLAINRSTSGGRAIMWTWNSAADFQDSALTLIDRYGSPQYTLSHGTYAGQYLTYVSDTSGAAVNFGGSGSTVWDN